ncbi:MAG TPA: DMT family transporter [Xanthobacteraceae bacterium]|jgi:drug/metabolite transporter (DMT)-like permease
MLHQRASSQTLQVPGSSTLRTAKHGHIDAGARLLLVWVALAWGSTWPALRIALDDIPPFSMRVATSVLGAAAMFALAFWQRRELRIGGFVARLHVVVSGCLNVAAFSVFTAFAQLATTTSRVAVVSYTMPIWAALLARFVLGERLTGMRGLSLMLCMIGLAVLLYPQLGSPDFIGLGLALAAAVCWAAGTVYVKWAQIDADPLATSAWQMIVALVISAACLLPVEGALHLWTARTRSLLALVFAGIAGSAVAYSLWFEIVRRLPATTAALGLLNVPVVGLFASMLALGERPTMADLIGFAFIFVAAACVLLTPATRLPQPRSIDPPGR